MCDDKASERKELRLKALEVMEASTSMSLSHIDQENSSDSSSYDEQDSAAMCKYYIKGLVKIRKKLRKPKGFYKKRKFNLKAEDFKLKGFRLTDDDIKAAFNSNIEELDFTKELEDMFEQSQSSISSQELTNQDMKKAKISQEEEEDQHMTDSFMESEPVTSTQVALSNINSTLCDEPQTSQPKPRFKLTEEQFEQFWRETRAMEEIAVREILAAQRKNSQNSSDQIDDDIFMAESEEGFFDIPEESSKSSLAESSKSSLAENFAKAFAFKPQETPKTNLAALKPKVASDKNFSNPWSTKSITDDEKKSSEKSFMSENNFEDVNPKFNPRPSSSVPPKNPLEGLKPNPWSKIDQPKFSQNSSDGFKLNTNPWPKSSSSTPPQNSSEELKLKTNPWSKNTFSNPPQNAPKTVIPKSNPWSKPTQVKKVPSSENSFNASQSKPSQQSQNVSEDLKQKTNPWSKAKAPMTSQNIPKSFSSARNPWQVGNRKPEQQKPVSPPKTFTSTNPWQKMIKKSTPFDASQQSTSTEPAKTFQAPEVAKRVEEENKNPFSSFKTGRQQLSWQDNNKNVRPIGLSRKHVPSQQQSRGDDQNPVRRKFQIPYQNENISSNARNDPEEEFEHPLLQAFDKKLLQKIKNDIMAAGTSQDISWGDIAGLEKAKEIIHESIVLPSKNPSICFGLRKTPTRNFLLFGPPGTGKTLIGKCIANEVEATFMSISASTLTSKWIGESETLVRAMFAYAKVLQPCVIFFDEVDSLLGKRDDAGTNGESMNRLKTEFLVQLDGANSLKDSDNVILIGATNRPYAIDEAMIRRFTRRILIPLPNVKARAQLISNLLEKSQEIHSLTSENLKELAERTEGYSGADLKNVAIEASQINFRRALKIHGHNLTKEDITPTSFGDFLIALKTIRKTVSKETVDMLVKWNADLGSGAATYSDDED